jgi:hypothetical protein
MPRGSPVMARALQNSPAVTPEGDRALFPTQPKEIP